LPLEEEREDAFRSICSRILNIDDTILGTSIIDKGGNIRASMSKPAFESRFNVPPDLKANSGTAAIMMVGMAKDMERAFGITRSITSIHAGCILMLIPITTSFDEEIFIGLVLQPSVNTEYIIGRIQKSLKNNATSTVE
jgi:hypothetical protein